MKRYSKEQLASMRLFKFCKIKFTEKIELKRVADGEFGSLVGFDAPTTSFWKHGKRIVKDVDTILTLSQKLNLDFLLLCQIALGEVKPREVILGISKE